HASAAPTSASTTKGRIDRDDYAAVDFLRRSRHEPPSGAHRRRADPAAVPLALARQVVPADPALPDPYPALDRVHPDDDRRLLRACLHRPLPARHLRLQPRRPALDMARLL